VDSAIDLGIAIDALFLADKDADRGELGLTLRLRAAHFLAGKAQEDRKDISDLFSALYLLRNVAVHAGSVPDKIKSPASKPSRIYETPMLLNEGYRLAGEAIRRIIREGEPDWRSIIFS
jgi:hypothetical protein